MAKSKFEYVRKFEQLDRCMPNTWIVVRIDGKGFHKFSDQHSFTKPNDARALHLMNHCAESVLTSFSDVLLGYGQSDEYSFVFKRKSECYNRRASKLMTTIVSLFTSTYVFSWSRYFPDRDLRYPPSFDSRVVLYPTTRNLRDYFSWRQVDCHINNLYNTCFWKLVLEKRLTKKEAEATLKVTDSALKNELLFSEFNTNYNDESEIFKKGTVVYRQPAASLSGTAAELTNEKPSNDNLQSLKQPLITMDHIDIIKNHFWTNRPYLLGEKVDGD